MHGLCLTLTVIGLLAAPLGFGESGWMAGLYKGISVVSLALALLAYTAGRARST